MALAALVALPILLNCTAGGDGETLVAVDEATPATEGSTPVSTAEICNLRETPYDVLMIATTLMGEIRGEIRYSRNDMHLVQTMTDHEGVLQGKGEIILKDRTRYSRQSSPHNAEVYGEWLVHGTNDSGAFPPPCFDPDSLEEDSSGSSDEPHFTSEQFLSQEEGSQRNEYWVDSKGRPTRLRRTIFPPKYDGVSNTDVGVLEFTYFGYGEPNIIEAPCAGAAPDEADNPALMRDCIHLLRLKDTLRGTSPLNWSVDTAITSWEGVTLGGTPRRIRGLDLSSRSLTGSIASLSELSASRLELTHLNLSNNSLTGEIASWLGRLTNLVELRLSGNSLTGCIPLLLKDVATNDLSSLNLLYCHPPKPENLTVVTVTETTISLSWDPVPNASKYRVNYVPGEGGVVITDDDAIAGTSHTVYGLTCGSEYEFKVDAYDSGTEYAEAWSETSWIGISESTGECTGQ